MSATPSQCPTCGAPIAPGAHFCGSCGHVLAQAAGGHAMELCASCGVVRLPHKAKCAHCNADHAPTALTHPRGADEHWACVECGFTCRACGFVVPINHLDMDGGVLCARCGLEQAFDVSQWRTALGESHAVADLFGSDVPGRPSDFVALGKSQSSVKQSLGGANNFEVKSSPGHPLCAHCHSIVSVSLGEGKQGKEGDTIVSCATCNTKETYKLPNAARQMTHGALKGIIATEHRSDRAAVNVEESQGAIAVRCPSCSAPLPASDSSKFLKCTFCDTVSRIPDHTWFRMSGKAPVSESMWMLFHGPSDKRKELEGREKRHHLDDEQRASIERGRERRAEEERERRAEESRKASAREAVLEEEREAAREKQRAAEARTRMFSILGGSFAVILFAAVFVVEQGTKKDVKQKMPSTWASAASSASSARTAKTAPKPVPPALVYVPSCTCSTHDSSTKNTFRLEAPMTVAGTAFRFDWVQKSGFIETASTLMVSTLDGRVDKPATSTSAATSSIHMGIACDGATVVLIGGNAARGYMGNDPGWVASLPGTFTPKLDASITPTTTANLSIACAAPLAVDDGVVALTLDNGKRIRLSLKNGKFK